jgi:hypothetical protein
MSQQAMVAHRYPDILRQNPHHDKRNKRRPPKTKERGQRSKMKEDNGNRKNPVGPTFDRLRVKRHLVVHNNGGGLRVLRTKRRSNLHEEIPHIR